MHQVGYGPDFVDVRFGSKNDTSFVAWKKSWLFFDRNAAIFAVSDKAELDMRYIRCAGKREYVVRLYTIVVLLKALALLSIKWMFKPSLTGPTTIYASSKT